MIRVAALMDTVKVSGPARQLAAIVEPLAALGVHVHVMAFHPANDARTPFIDFLAARGVPHTAVPAYGRLRWRTLTALDAAFSDFAPTIIQTHSYRPNAHVLALRLLRRRREPWLAFFHGVTAENRLVKLYHQLDRVMLARADAVAVVAESQLHNVGRRDGVTVVPNAVLPVSAEELARREQTTHDAAPEVLFVGRLSYEKGVDVLLSAWPDVLRENASARLQIVGDGPERINLEAQVTSLGITGSVSFHGHHAEPWAYYRTAALVVLPSRSEGVPNVLLEAIARDIPLVATRVGGIPHVLGDPPAGLLVESNNSNSLSSGILQALESERDVELQALRGRVRMQWSVDTRAETLVALYCRIRAWRG